MNKLLTNYHTIVNMSPLPTEILREREKKNSLGHIRLNSQIAIQKALQIKIEEKKKKKIQWSKSSFADILYNNGNTC